jgi:hypothetical protein
LATGINTVPGAAVRKVVFSTQKAEEWAERAIQEMILADNRAQVVVEEKQAKKKKGK